jgi:hypothetical protein
VAAEVGLKAKIKKIYIKNSANKLKILAALKQILLKDMI